MKIIHVPYVYHPDPCGGTEVYVAMLCRSLKEQAGVVNVVAAPGGEARTYEHGGLRVRRFATHPLLTQEMMYGEGDPAAADGFAGILDEEAPDVVHFHAFTPAVSVLCLREAQRRGVRTLCTYHTPTQSCLRGTLLRWGDEVCDGVMDRGRCAACYLHSLGVPPPAAGLAALASFATWPLALAPGLSNAAKLLLGSTRLTGMRHEATREWWAGMSRVIALCDWTRRLLENNDVPPEKIVMVRHGLSAPAPQPPRPPIPGPLRFIILGRLDPAKGLDVIIDALSLAPDLAATLDIFAIVPPHDKAVQALLARTARDSRITVKPPVTPDQVELLLRDYDCLLVPSRWMETGPLVVLEAFAAGLPVIGARLGGIAEKVSHEVDGLLVGETTAEAWSKVLRRAVEEPDLLNHLRAGVKLPRTMHAVAGQMLEVYEAMMAAASLASSHP